MVALPCPSVAFADASSGTNVTESLEKRDVERFARLRAEESGNGGRNHGVGRILIRTGERKRAAQSVTYAFQASFEVKSPDFDQPAPAR